jgi:hypothetical protein
MLWVQISIRMRYTTLCDKVCQWLVTGRWRYCSKKSIPQKQFNDSIQKNVYLQYNFFTNCLDWCILLQYTVCTNVYQGDINIVTLENSNYIFISHLLPGPSWSWSYGTCSWIYNYLCNQCLSPLMLWVRISIRAKCATLCDKDCQWLATGRWFSISFFH